MNDRLQRLLLVVPAARARPGIAVAELARALACDEQDLRRDLDLLACVGSPPYQPDDLIDIEVRDDRVWVTLPQAFDRPARLLATEAAALTIAARALAPNDPVTRSAVDKLARAVMPAQRALYDGLLSRIAAAPADATAGVESVLREAIRDRREITIDYLALGQATGSRIVQPRALATVDGMRYLSARKKDGADRVYRVDRIRHAELRRERFDPLPSIDLDGQMRQVAGFNRREDLPRATLRFEPAAAEAARARHPAGRMLKDGSFEADLPYSTLGWLVSYALSWSGNAIVTGPREARAAFAQAIDQATEAQREPKGRPRPIRRAKRPRRARA